MYNIFETVQINDYVHIILCTYVAPTPNIISICFKINTV